MNRNFRGTLQSTHHQQCNERSNPNNPTTTTSFTRSFFAASPRLAQPLILSFPLNRNQTKKQNATKLHKLDENVIKPTDLCFEGVSCRMPIKAGFDFVIQLSPKLSFSLFAARTVAVFLFFFLFGWCRFPPFFPPVRLREVVPFIVVWDCLIILITVQYCCLLQATATTDDTLPTSTPRD